MSRAGRFQVAQRPLDGQSLALLRLVENKQDREAVVLARKLLERRPRNALVSKALAAALIRLGEIESALPILAQALALAPRDPELLNNQGIALSQLFRWDQAADSFLGAMKLAPRDPVVHKNYAVALLAEGRPDQAIGPLLKAIELYDGDYVEAINQLVRALISMQRYEEARVCLDELHRNDPAKPEVFYRLLHAKMHLCEWDGVSDGAERLAAATNGYQKPIGSPFISMALPGMTDRDHLEIARTYVENIIPPKAFEIGERQRTAARAKERLRVGYVSADLRNHVVGKVVSEVIERHDRSKYEVIGYAISPDDKSGLRRRLAAGFDEFFDLTDELPLRTAERIRRDGIDILVDLQTWTSRPRPEIFALRAAPVQVGWLGYPGTSGDRRLLDYLIGDRIVTPPEAADCFAETLALMPHCYLPADTTIVAATPPSRADVGLPDDSVVFCSLVTVHKINPAVFDTWAEILREIPKGVLWISEQSAAVADRLRHEISVRGIDPVRLVFASKSIPYDGHYARLQLADLMLDPWPYNGHSTMIDALWAGLPVVTWRGQTFAGRVGASLLMAAGLGDLVNASVDDYRGMAVRLARDKELRARYRARVIAARHSPLFDTIGFTRALEGLYRRMWEDACQGRREIIIGST